MFYKPVVVVVPLYFELKLIKHKGGASLSDVGLLHNEHAHTHQENKAVRVSSFTGYKVYPFAWGENPQSEQIDCVSTKSILNHSV